MNHNEFANELFDRDIVVDKIVWLAATCANPPPALADLYEDDPETLATLLGVDQNLDLDEMLQRTKNLGFLLDVRTPVRRYWKPEDPESPYESGWGLIHTDWIYTESLSLLDALTKLVAWAEGKSQLDRERRYSTPST